VEFSFEALDEAAVGFRRVESFLARASEYAADAPAELPGAFTAAMDDDLGTPAAVAVLHDSLRQGNRQLAEGDRTGLAATHAAVTAMLGVLGLDPSDPAWGGPSTDDGRLTQAVDVLVRGLLEQRAQAREAKDWATADAIRDRIKAAGIEIEDTPEGSKWSL
jgi:cysteinyl-tRNA synthetase